MKSLPIRGQAPLPLDRVRDCQTSAPNVQSFSVERMIEQYQMRRFVAARSCQKETAAES